MKEIKKCWESQPHNNFHSIDCELNLIKSIIISVTIVLLTLLVTVFIIQQTH